MSALRDIRLGIKETLENNLPNVIVYNNVDDVVQVPAVVVMPYDGTYDVTFCPKAQWTLRLSILLPRTETSYSQWQLDDFLAVEGDQSLRAIFLRNPNLGLGDVDAHLRGLVPGSYGGSFQAARVPHTGCVVELIVRDM